MSETEIHLVAGELEATVLPELGMVVSSLRRQGQELLGQRGGPRAYRERGSTFGVPILYPWANRLMGWDYEFAGQRVHLEAGQPALKLDSDTGFPMHGLLTASPHWQVGEVSDALLPATLDFAAVPEYMAAFPFPHTLELAIGLSADALTLTLVVTPTGELPVPISFGFHPYLTPPGEERADWELSLPVGDGTLDGPLSVRAFDDGYTSLIGQPPRFVVIGGGRTLTVRFLQNYDVAQIYSPAGAEFICFEPMTAPVDALRTGDGLGSVAPGETFTAQFEITVL